MKKIIAFTITASLMVFSVASQALENCPQLKNIEEIGSGVYRAEGDNGEWQGVVQGIIADKTPVKSFEQALAIQGEASAPIKLQYCTYMLENRGALDMRFTAKNERDFTIQTEGDAWKKEEGSFGMIYNVCEKTAPENCKFTVIQ
ncbi:DUF3757 domain-containing protein [Serratia quinivorans]|uniref:DUF3757 domain-containing protein n=1 Tax=Serratia quinivorans TaxID=137545 RepID=UPI002178B9F2|nr:DUF3757 domain-containing protein [Serratia quinivorans]CAI0718333.1 Protein of uncharacterised function (DUF3757) [Serratia quinivorans]CAI2034190.1 Protein of uncharacterised function (DUF3757) [Serratia quinivorans]